MHHEGGMFLKFIRLPTVHNENYMKARNKENVSYFNILTGIFVVNLIFTYHTPPKGISISLKLSTSIILLFRQVNKITRKYQTKEADVQSGYELLKWMEKKMLSSCSKKLSIGAFL